MNSKTNAAPYNFRLFRGTLIKTLRVALMFALLPALLIASTEMAHAQTETVLYSFCSLANCADGSEPLSNLISDANGNFYGTTAAGGEVGGACASFGCGTVFEISKSGVATVLYNFSGIPDGEGPSGSLVGDSNGNLYGTTQAGGISGSACPSDGCGTVFELVKTGETYTEKVLYAFAGGTDGSDPSGIARDTDGNLYGTTPGGGAPDCASSPDGCGLVFKVAPTGNEEVFYRFKGKGNGANPTASVVLDAEGNLYGTADSGGRFGGICTSYGCGTVFKLSPGGKEDVLYRFRGLADGRGPIGPLVLDAEGNLYGVTSTGGDSKNIECSVQADGCGVVFELTEKAELTVLYTFTGYPADGQHPLAGLVSDKQGNLFGTTSGGGPSNDGTVFEVSPTGVETVLHNFSGGADGFNPRASLLLDAKGNLYGTTIYGGAYGDGTVFKVVP
jgi:uncharacterized repeat protein (TIGR03803 family)